MKGKENLEEEEGTTLKKLHVGCDRSHHIKVTFYFKHKIIFSECSCFVQGYMGYRVY